MYTKSNIICQNVYRISHYVRQIIQNLTEFFAINMGQNVSLRTNFKYPGIFYMKAIDKYWPICFI